MAEIIMMAMAQEEDDAYSRVPRPNFAIKRTECFTELSDAEFIKEFRLTKTLALQLIQELKPYIETRSTRDNALRTENKVLCALNFFASGGYQRKVGKHENITVSQQSASRYIAAVSVAMSTHLLAKYVMFPADQRVQARIKEEFFQCCDLGGVIGAIDCTHVAIIAPPNDEFHHEKNYINRKGWYSINVQLICDMNALILNVVARYPGCTGDSYIWRSSNLKAAFDGGNIIDGDGWLLGDGGYPMERHLHVPIDDAVPGSSAETYNKAHARGRCVIERCNGILKNRFRCLLKHRVLHYNPEAASHIVNSCVILHNMCIDDNIFWEEENLEEEDELFDTIESDYDEE